MTDNSIPFYDLYGEAFIRKEPNVAHVEDIAARSRGLGWEIEPHRHNRLSQVIAVFDNHWSVELDDRVHHLEGNWLVLIPAGVVHGFRFAPDTKGSVISISDTLLEVNGVLATLPGMAWLPQPIEFKDKQQIARFKTYIGLLKNELMCDELAQNIAVNQLVQLILLTVMRQQRLHAITAGATSRDSNLLLSFRRLVEQYFTQHVAIQFYAEQLCISVSTLNRLCHNLLNDSPKAIVHQRIIIEAKRRLIYTRQTVEEVSELLGFNDPAYFSRFFKQMVGTTASAFRHTSNIM